MSNDDFKRFYGFLGKYAELLNQQLVEADCDATGLARRQGRTQAVTRLITAIATSGDALRQYRTSRD